MTDIKISILVPAFNEETRIPKFLKELLKFADNNLESYEIIVINDGSLDKTKETVLKLITNHNQARLLSYEDNMGKGHAVLQGILNAKGEFILFIDADGSIKPLEILNMYKIFQKSHFDIIVGSRILKSSNITESQPLSRRLMSKIFNLYSNILFRINISDLLCGFKGFSREVANKVFIDMKAYRWEFDVEILYRARKNEFNVFQLPIEWRHEEGSKMKLLDPVLIFLNLFKLRLSYL
ncbi:MAG: glycosyltransferase family 2 protein [Candidatus Atribacteria bacterium]|nr:MAG: glycosyltransferase family 2 protein [Candidatus Atribacteria bacterium]